MGGEIADVKSPVYIIRGNLLPNFGNTLTIGMPVKTCRALSSIVPIFTNCNNNTNDGGDIKINL